MPTWTGPCGSCAAKGMASDLHDLDAVRAALREHARPAAAETAAWFFKAGPGEYGEGDRFLGIKVPKTREVARRAKAIPWNKVPELLRSPWHEERLCALFLWVNRFPKADPPEQEQIVGAWLEHSRWINNWDLVDSSAPHILGQWLLTHPDERDVLDRLASSEMLWQRRMAIVATYALIREQQFHDTLRIATTLLDDPHDLIHKAVGWMLREVGNRAFDLEVGFLDTHYRTMPRTMLRYAIEKFPEPMRQAYLKGNR